MSLLAVDDAVRTLLETVEPLGAETVALTEAAGRVLASPLTALRTQPPFPASAMDGYALRAADALPGATLRVIGESRAGLRFGGAIGPGEAVRIFTGAPVPEGADSILIQENADRDGDVLRPRQGVRLGHSVRAAGLDFHVGDMLLETGRLIDSRAIALAAAMGHVALLVRRRPRVAILSNGDELVAPGAATGPDQIISSNGVGLQAFVRECGGEPLDLGIAPDQVEAIARSVAQADGADILVVVGGASVGDHDLVKETLAGLGMELDFWRIAMRPGKPLMVGRLGPMRVLGLPGNPVSALVCAHLFLKPLIRAMLGLPPLPLVMARLGAALPENDERQDYVRAELTGGDGERIVTAFARQDSSMLGVFAAAGALIIRPVRAPAAKAGDLAPTLLL